MKSSSPTHVAVSIFLGILIITAVVVVTTDLRVESFGPVIVYGVAFVGVGMLLLAPIRRGGDR